MGYSLHLPERPVWIPIQRFPYIGYQGRGQRKVLKYASNLSWNRQSNMKTISMNSPASLCCFTSIVKIVSLYFQNQKNMPYAKKTWHANTFENCIIQRFLVNLWEQSIDQSAASLNLVCLSLADSKYCWRCFGRYSDFAVLCLPKDQWKGSKFVKHLFVKCISKIFWCKLFWRKKCIWFGTPVSTNLLWGNK